MSGFTKTADPVRLKISGYDAVQAGGTYVKNDTKRAIIQTTVVIPAPDGIFVLQMNADAPADEQGVLTEATKVLNDTTKITV